MLFPLNYFRVCRNMHLLELTVLCLGHNNAPLLRVTWFGQAPPETDIASALVFRGCLFRRFQKVQ